MTLYCIVCYLIMLGMIVEDHDNSEEKYISYWSLVLAPLLVPIFIGMKIQEPK